MMSATNTSPPVRQRFTRGWFVLMGLFAVMTLNSGFAFYAQGVFLDALVNEQGFSVGIAGAGTGVFFVSSGICGYFTGGLVNRFDVRWVMTIGTVIAAVGMALVGEIRTEWHLFSVMVVFGIGFALTGLVPTTTVVTRWFQRKRSVALAIASTGLSVGGIAIAPVLAAVIDRDTLEDSAATFAVIFFGSLLVAVWLLVRASPESMGLRPDGDPPPEGTKAGDPLPMPAGASFAQAVRSRYFIFLSLGYVLIMGTQVGVIQHVFKLTKERVDLETAQTALILLSATSVVFRIIGGLVALRVPLRQLTILLALVQCGGVYLLAVSEERLSVLVATVIIGSAVGNLLMLHPLLLADAFGVRNYARIYGLGSLLMVLGVGSGPFVVGVIRDQVDYRLAFFVLIGVGLVGITIFMLAGNPVGVHLETPAHSSTSTHSQGTPPHSSSADSTVESVVERELVPLGNKHFERQGRAPKVFEVLTTEDT